MSDGARLLATLCWLCCCSAWFCCCMSVARWSRRLIPPITPPAAAPAAAPLAGSPATAPPTGPDRGASPPAPDHRATPTTSACRPLRFPPATPPCCSFGLNPDCALAHDWHRLWVSPEGDRHRAAHGRCVPLWRGPGGPYPPAVVLQVLVRVMLCSVLYLTHRIAQISRSSTSTSSVSARPNPRVYHFPRAASQSAPLLRERPVRLRGPRRAHLARRGTPWSCAH